MRKQILIPLPSHDFDPTECAVPWSIITDAGLQVTFATPHGFRAECDRRMLLGSGLGLLAPLLAANRNARDVYERLEADIGFNNPKRWDEINPHQFDGLILPGGHAPGMKEYLESSSLQKVVCEFFRMQKPVGAICHGVVLAARSQLNGQSVLRGLRTTALLAKQEMLAWNLTRFWLGNYYRTYSTTVEDEVRAVLASPADFLSGPTPLFRDSLSALKNGFTVKDGNYLSARWPGDAFRFGVEFLQIMRQN